MTSSDPLTGARKLAGQERPLEGLSALALGPFIAGPFATRIMTRLGAEVVKPKRPGTEDPLRNRRCVDPRTKALPWWSLQSLAGGAKVSLDFTEHRGVDAKQAS